jgi:hypothetical protein
MMNKIGRQTTPTWFKDEIGVVAAVIAAAATAADTDERPMIAAAASAAVIAAAATAATGAGAASVGSSLLSLLVMLLLLLLVLLQLLLVPPGSFLRQQLGQLGRSPVSRPKQLLRATPASRHARTECRDQNCRYAMSCHIESPLPLPYSHSHHCTCFQAQAMLPGGPTCVDTAKSKPISVQKKLVSMSRSR